MVTNHALTSLGDSAVTVGDRAQEDAWELLSESTRRAYRSDWRVWQAWCIAASGASPLPADAATVARFVRERGQLVDEQGDPVESVATLTRRVAAIAFVHRAYGHASPTGQDEVRFALRLERRRRGRAGQSQTRRAAALTLEPLEQLLAAVDVTTWPAAVIGRRDTALILTGFVTAMRRSELAALQRRDLVLTSGQGRMTIRSSKTDQDAAGALVVLPPAVEPARCAPCALWRWVDLVDAADAHDGPYPIAALARVVFADQVADKHVCRRTGTWAGDERSLFRRVTKAGYLGAAGITGETVHRRIQHWAAAAGLDDQRITGHSLRAGFVTQALAQGIDPWHVMRQTRHASLATLRVYERHHSPETANAAMELGL